jgi:hypothetical protein
MDSKETTLPNNVTICSNDTCKERLNCKRFLAEKPNELYWEAKFEEINCDFKIEV